MANKKKQLAKGQKKIFDENQETLRFYRNLTLGVSGAYFLVDFVLLRLFTAWYIIVFILCSGVYLASYHFMVSMATPTYSEGGHLTDGGVDLNMEGGIAEHLKDLLILTAGCQLLSLLTNYSWFVWLLVPGRLSWLVSVNFIIPYFTQPPPNPLGLSERQQRRMERKMKRRPNK